MERVATTTRQQVWRGASTKRNNEEQTNFNSLENDNQRSAIPPYQPPTPTPFLPHSPPSLSLSPSNPNPLFFPTGESNRRRVMLAILLTCSILPFSHDPEDDGYLALVMRVSATIVRKVHSYESDDKREQVV